MKKAALHNLGCKVNSYETEAMQQMLENAGYEIVAFSDKADVYIINTCSVTNMADRKSRQMLHKAKHKNPDSVVVATGCYAQTKEDEALLDPAIDIVIGNNQKHELINRLDMFFGDSSNNAAVADINNEPQEYEELFLSKTAEHARAFIKVQDGCNQFCSYCIIPYARGRVRSRKLKNVLAEVVRLVDNGFKEIVLTGIHLSSYGVDLENGENLLKLIQEVHKIEGLERIRLGSLEPKIVTEEFVENIAKLPKMCPHFHLSLQSGCDATLKRMNRKYTTEEYIKGCELLRKYFKHPAITTDVIVGFPGEDENEFSVTKQFLKDVHFYKMHVFKYSPRRGTRAESMPNQVDEQVKTRRSAELIELDHQMSKEYRDFYIGTQKQALIEEKVTIDGKDYYTGYTMEYVKIAVESEEDLINQIVTGKIIKEIADDIYLLKR
ncbi:tRNA (N(6)-L-threonylcarbamoyladenosine(37)-C(2))-methylthiotransferase MtaB [Lachnobacterium bovis]|uniref:Threonylcarbamoyladenosine tRNA methylthiotransferase MtaB n=1 Tax=Lachnobacterium bovis TaxID=140626 RepID=A0A1H9RG27_9FIRM|nr:tRNA (N(6)-L-threonylcarbamoyladenosine(37)-C(2))-methylthiotransferase MtaB [Lachnobacterium bovis]SER71587.1 threonylcarbamoyladenosine tRNA methylthiotransferase MtaB [Lachnobacterium bovis]